MSKTILAGALMASVLATLPLAACADSGHGHETESTSSGGHHGDEEKTSTTQPADLAGAWQALTAARDAIAGDVESGALGDIPRRSRAPASASPGRYGGRCRRR